MYCLHFGYPLNEIKEFILDVKGKSLDVIARPDCELEHSRSSSLPNFVEGESKTKSTKIYFGAGGRRRFVDRREDLHQQFIESPRR